jgi:hypothetical protein
MNESSSSDRADDAAFCRIAAPLAWKHSPFMFDDASLGTDSERFDRSIDPFVSDDASILQNAASFRRDSACSPWLDESFLQDSASFVWNRRTSLRNDATRDGN